MTRCSLRRQMIDQKGERLIDRLGIDHVIIIQHQHDIDPGCAAISFSSAVSSASVGGGCGD